MDAAGIQTSWTKISLDIWESEIVKRLKLKDLKNFNQVSKAFQKLSQTSLQKEKLDHIFEKATGISNYTSSTFKDIRILDCQKIQESQALLEENIKKSQECFDQEISSKDKENNQLELVSFDITYLPNIGVFEGLKILSIKNSNIQYLNPSVYDLSTLEVIQIEGKLKGISDKIEKLSSLKELHFARNEIVHIPQGLINLAKKKDKFSPILDGNPCVNRCSNYQILIDLPSIKNHFYMAKPNPAIQQDCPICTSQILAKNISISYPVK